MHITLFSASAINNPILQSFVIEVGRALCELNDQLVRDNITATAKRDGTLIDLTVDFNEEDIGKLHMKMTFHEFPNSMRSARFGMASMQILVNDVELQNGIDQPGELMHVLQQIQPLFEEIELQPQEKTGPVLDVVTLFSDMQANALRILDLTVQRNGATPSARRLNIEESELWTTFGDGMYWYDEPATGAIYYVVLFVLPAKYDVPAGNPENDRLAFFFKQVGRHLTLAEIRVNGADIANAAGSFSGWIFSNEELLNAFYERSEEMRAEIENANPWPEAKPVRVTIESDDPHQAAMLTALLREAILLRDMKMSSTQREHISTGGRHGLEIQVPDQYRDLFNEAYNQKEKLTLDHDVVDVRPLLVQIRVK